MPFSTAYLLTSTVCKRLKKLGFELVCYKCGDPLLLGNMVVPRRGGGMRVKKLFHVSCWENMGSTEASPPVGTKRRALPAPPEYKIKSPVPHIRLEKGVFVENPHEQVLCPRLLCRDTCRKRPSKWQFYRPTLLLKHHSDPRLQLWECLGCPDFLLRVELNG